jgi:hypothetical protein
VGKEKQVTTANAIRFLHSEAGKCRDRDACEALCLLLPAMLKVLGLEAMEDVEAAAFRYELKQRIHALPQFQDATDRADARPVASLMQHQAHDAASQQHDLPAARGARPEAPGARFEPAPAAS